MWRRVPIAWELSLENSADFYMFSTASYFFVLYHRLLHLHTVFDSISSNIDEVLSINPSANVFIFGDFNIDHKGWLTYSGGTDRPGEFWYNFSISNDHTWMVKFPTSIHDSDSHGSALLGLYISSNTIICSTMSFLPLGNSNQVVVSVSIDVPLNSKLDVPFHHIAHDNSHVYWITLDHLTLLIIFVIIWEMFHGRISLNSVPLLLLVNFVSGFMLELIYISLIVSVSSSLNNLLGF